MVHGSMVVAVYFLQIYLRVAAQESELTSEGIVSLRVYDLSRYTLSRYNLSRYTLSRYNLSRYIVFLFFSLSLFLSLSPFSSLFLFTLYVNSKSADSAPNLGIHIVEVLNIFPVTKKREELQGWCYI